MACITPVRRSDARPLPSWAAELNRFGRERQACFFLLDFELEAPLITAPDGEGIRFHFPGRPDVPPAPFRPALEAYPIPVDRFERAFDVIQGGLGRGDSFLTNLTFATPVDLRGTLEDVYAATEAKYRVLLAGGFVCFSPETFVTISEAGYLETHPMKGTAPDTAADRRALLASAKETAEHATIVDLLRNDLSRVATGVEVTDYRYLRRIESGRGGLVQTSSKIGGRLPTDWPGQLGTILYELLPAGSVSGAPKEATLALIRAAEEGPRGYYCGVAGYYDGRTLDTCVLIRYLEATPAGYFFRSGGGITALSEAAAEYAELNAKIRLPYRKMG